MWSRWAARLRDVREARLLAWAGTRRPSALVALGLAGVGAEDPARRGGSAGGGPRPVPAARLAVKPAAGVAGGEGPPFLGPPGRRLPRLRRGGVVNLPRRGVAQGRKKDHQQLVKNRLL